MKVDPVAMTVTAHDPVPFEMKVVQLRYRDDIASLLSPDSTGIELGVAEGWFSEALLKTSSIGFLYGVDMYEGDRGHDVEQYKRALARLTTYRARYALLRMRFEQALSLFPDEHFDFVYVDGYAHTGEENGKTIHDWYPKVRKGGIFAGDDYSPRFPLVTKAVDEFAAQYDLKLHVIEFVKGNDWTSQFPGWIVIKPG